MSSRAPDHHQTQWPALPLEAWVDTKRTLHRCSQVVGKIRLALFPFRNHWWHVTLYVDTRGLTTGPMPSRDGRSVEIVFDFVDHRLDASTSDGRCESFQLANGLRCRTSTVNCSRRSTRWTSLCDHDTYEAPAVTRYWTVLRHSADVLNEFAGWFNGKQSPVHLFWHSFDLALARFSGRVTPQPVGTDRVTAEAYSRRPGASVTATRWGTRSSEERV